jgi:hypothetical protein
MNKINQLRNILNQETCDAYLIPKNDEYFGEHVPENKDRLKFISGIYWFNRTCINFKK